MSGRNEITSLLRFASFARVVMSGETMLLKDAARLSGVSERTALRYVKAMKSYDPRLKASRGVGIQYRRNERI